MIYKAKAIGILSCLDEDFVMSKTTDKSFTEKLSGLWKGQSDQFDCQDLSLDSFFHITQERSHNQRLAGQGQGSVERERDKILATSQNSFIASMFDEHA